MEGMKRIGEWEEVVPAYSKVSASKEHEFSGVISNITKEIGVKDIIDFGCGDGKLCNVFSKHDYLGLDIDDKTLQKARSHFEGYAFNTPEEKVYNTDMCICSRVFSQLNEESIHDIIRRMRCKWLLIAEPLHQSDVDGSIYPFYTRERESYINLMRHHDLLLVKHIVKPSKEKLGGNVSFLLFKKYGRNPIGTSY